MTTGAWGWVGAQQKTLEFEAEQPEVIAAGRDVAPPGRMRQRYNNAAKQAEVSIDGSDYAFLTDASGSPWKEYPGNVVGLVDTSNRVSVGGTTSEGGLQVTGPDGTPMIVVGDTAAAGRSSWIKILPEVAGEPAAGIGYKGTVFNGVNDEVFDVGINCKAGGVADVSIWGCFLQIENHFFNGVTHLLECFFAASRPTTGTQIRPVSFTVDRVTEFTTTGLVGDSMTFYGVGGNEMLTMDDAVASASRVVRLGSGSHHYWPGRDRALLTADVPAAGGGIATPNAEVMRTAYASAKSRVQLFATGSFDTLDVQGDLEVTETSQFLGAAYVPVGTGYFGGTPAAKTALAGRDTFAGATFGDIAQYAVMQSSNAFYLNLGGSTRGVFSSLGLSLGNSTTEVGTSLLVDLVSTARAFGLMSMTTAQKNAISPRDGAMVYDSDLDKACIRANGAWETITSA